MIITEWNLFRMLDLERVKLLLRRSIVDLRNVYEPEKMRAAGFRYVSVGRPERKPEAAPLRAVGGRRK